MYKISIERKYEFTVDTVAEAFRMAFEMISANREAEIDILSNITGEVLLSYDLIHGVYVSGDIHYIV